MGNGRHVHFLEGNVDICLPSVPCGAKSFGQNQKGTGGDRTSCTVVAKKSLVTQPSRVEHGAAKGASIAQETGIAAQNRYIPSESAGAPVSHLETIAKGVRSAGFSKDVAEQVARGKLRQSSLKVYDSRWMAFVLGAMPEGFCLGMPPCSR